MSRARPVLPTDFIALVSSAQAGQNEAWPRERVNRNGSSLSPAGMMFDQVLGNPRGRGAWIHAERHRLQGLISASRRGSKRAWEIDYLADASPDLDAALDLLECVVAATGRRGGEKVFLRLRAVSHLLPPARTAGFLPYKEETLYAHDGELPLARPHSNLRPAVAADSYRIFRLYCESTPESVRRLEAMTFGEWQAALEQRWLKNGLTLVEEQAGKIVLTIGASAEGGDLSLSWLGDGTPNPDIAGVIVAVLDSMPSRTKRLQILTPDHYTSLERVLLESGFEAQRSFVSLARRTTRPVAIAKMQPALARSAVEA